VALTDALRARERGPSRCVSKTLALMDVIKPFIDAHSAHAG
jgi:hypothetical protein